MTNRNTQLNWVQKNRGPRPERARPASTLVLEFARELGERYANVLQPLAECIAQIVDRRFRENCRLLDLSCGVLRFAVDDANLVPIMRMKWSVSILAALTARRNRTAFNVQQVRFE